MAAAKDEGLQAFGGAQVSTVNDSIMLLDISPQDPRLKQEVYTVLRELRTTLTVDQLELVYREGFPQGLRFTAAYRHAGGEPTECVGVAGWRIMWLTLALKKLYVDDLVTTEGARSLGVGRALLRYLEAKAKEAGCTRLDLDSGTYRGHAHKFYFRENLLIDAFHFWKQI